MGVAWSYPEVQTGETSVEKVIESGPDIPPTESTIEATETLILTTETELSDEDIKRNRQEDLQKLKDDLAVKRDLRRQKLGEVSDELNKLKDQLREETGKRLELEEQLKRYKNDNETSSSEEMQSSNNNMSSEVEALRISRYEEDDEDDIDILEEDGDDTNKMKDSQNSQKSVKKKKRVSFSLDLVKEEEDEPTEYRENESNENPENSETEEVKDDEVGTENTEESKEDSDDLQQKNQKLETQVKALKDVVQLSKELLTIRETQVGELNKRLAMVENKEKEFERKMSAMKELQKLYEERGRAILIEHKHQMETERTRVAILQSKLRLSEDTNEDLVEKNKHLDEKVKTLDSQLDDAKAALSETKIKLATEKESLYHASSQISLINNLVTQIISGPELDLGRLARFLEENHALISELTAKGDIDYVASALVGVAGGIVEIPKEEKSDIAENLGKVWRVLVELLSHHKKADTLVSSNNQEWDSCYKSVDTPKGPKLVISVSQTFIKLKDLILEKNSLVKEVGRLKKLNEHLECRMEEQEGRLTLVTEELHNTWDVVNKLKRQHDNLHTHESILKHELQHKRAMLNGLKKQLEICREQWTLAREKNSKTENDWLLLRAEFAMRKQKKKFFNSAESGYEDEEIQSPEYDTDDDKSLDIDESPDSSVNENLVQTGNTTPSEVSNSDASEEGNGPISEILDSIFDEALKVANTTKNAKQSTKQEIQEAKCSTDKQLNEVKDFSKIDNENLTEFPVLLDNDQISTNSEQNERNSFNFNCDIPRKHCLEQIPEVEESLIQENYSNNESTLETHDNLNNIQIIENVSLSSILSDEPIVNSLIKDDSQTSPLDSKTENVENGSESTSQESEIVSNKTETGSLKTDEILRRRDERLRRMEESCKSLFAKMGHTSNRGNEISNKLDQIHAVYGPQQQISLNEATISDDVNNSTADIQQNVTDELSASSEVQQNVANNSQIEQQTLNERDQQ